MNWNLHVNQGWCSPCPGAIPGSPAGEFLNRSDADINERESWGRSMGREFVKYPARLMLVKRGAKGLSHAGQAGLGSVGWQGQPEYLGVRQPAGSQIQATFWFDQQQDLECRAEMEAYWSRLDSLLPLASLVPNAWATPRGEPRKPSPSSSSPDSPTPSLLALPLPAFPPRPKNIFNYIFSQVLRLTLVFILSPPPSAFAFVCLAPLPSQLDNEECGVTLTSIGPATTSDPSR
ncbi:hypothetical protein D4764_05G0001030 [Takifugu flavidus]|uniref:Uncharacterized protein n=1 Tax=Takifugu flavidus TaxID=433684 RepID=A0A5C6MYF8_9TELE|nr:hypothetical protein D4764_05G0001030 [Takifugu flavidus]